MNLRTALEAFEDFVFDDSRAIREVVDSGEHNMADVLELIKEAEKFRSWVKDQPENVDLRKAYCKEVIRVGWAAKLPVRSVRWGLFTAMSRAASTVIPPPLDSLASVALLRIDLILFAAT